MAVFNWNSILESALFFLRDFANLNNSEVLLQQVFGVAIETESFLTAWRAGEFPALPQLEVIDSRDIAGARGAYGRETQTIYLSQQLLDTGNQSLITAVFLEEYGHYLDAQLNTVDTPGDEGQLFSAIARGVELSPESLASIQAEDDTATMVIGGQSVTIEKADTVTVSIASSTDPLSPAVSEDGAASLIYTFTLSAPAPVGGLTINYKLEGTATEELDYTDTNPTPGQLTIAEGGISGTVTITPTSDTLAEGSETVQLTLISSPDYVIGTRGTIVGTIVDNDLTINESDTIFVRGYYVYSLGVDGSGNESLTVFDVKNPANPDPSGTEYNFSVDINPPAPGFPAKGPALNSPTSVQVIRDYAYIGDASGIRIVSIVDPSAMKEVDFVATSQPVESLWVDREKGIVFAALGTAGVDAWWIDINNPDVPTKLFPDNTPYGFLSSPQNQLNGLNTAGTAYDLQYVTKTTIVDGEEVELGYLYVADGLNGLRIIDVSALNDPALADNTDPNLFFEVGDYNTPGDARAVKVVGSYAYIADGASGLQIIDISNPSVPVRVGQIDLLDSVNNIQIGNAVDVDVIGPFAYVSDGAAGVHLININDPTAPVFVETFDTPGNALGIQVADNVLFVADDTGGIHRFDVGKYTDRNVTLSVDLPEINENGTILVRLTNPDGTIDIETINVGFFTYTFSLPKVATEDITVRFNIQQPVTLLEGNTIAIADDPNNPDDSGDYSTGAVLDANGNGTITIRAGQTSATLRIAPTSDSLVESPESINVRLLEGDGYFPVSTSQVTGTIISQDLPNITVQASVAGDAPSTNAVNVFEDSGDTVTYTFRRSSNPQGRLVVYYSLGGTAASGANYTGPSKGEIREIVFEDPGTIRDRLLQENPSLDPEEATRQARQLASEQTITITPIANDVFEEEQKTVEVQLLSEVRVREIQLGVDNIGFFENTYSIGTTSTVTTNIIEDDPEPPIIQLALSSNSISEKNTEQLVYTFNLVNDAGDPSAFNRALTVNFNLSGSSASRGSDYTVTDGDGNVITGDSLVVQAGASQGRLIITPVEDTLLEVNETVSLALRAGNNYTPATTDALVGTIVNFDTFDPNSAPLEPEELFIRGHYAYTIDENGLTVFDVETPTNPAPDGTRYFIRIADATEVQIVRDFAYVASASGIHVISISDPSAMEQVDFFPTIQPVRGLWVDRQREFDGREVLYVARGEYGFEALSVDVNDPDLVKIEVIPRSRINTAGEASGVFSMGDLVYVADGSQGLRIIDVSNLSDPALAEDQRVPTVVGNYNTPGTALNVRVVGNYAYIADGVSGLQIVDISNPSQPVLVGQFDTSGFAYDLDVVGQFVYLADDTSGAHVIDISDPTTPVLVETFDTPGNAQGVQVADNVLFVADVTGELQRFDVSDYTDRNVILSVVSSEDPLSTTVSEDGNADLIYTFSLPKAATQDTIINFNIRQPKDASEESIFAIAGDDYNGVTLDANGNGSITILAGSTSATLTLSPRGDSLVENSENVVVTLLDGDNYRVGTRGEVVSSITSNDLASVSLIVSPSGSAEEGNTFVYTFRRTGLPIDRLTIYYEVGGNADANDYQIREGGSLNGEITFEKGETEKTITIRTIDDLAPEDTETVEITLLDRDPVIIDLLENSLLSAEERAELLSRDRYRVSTQDAVKATILDNEPEVTLSISPTLVSERGDGTLVYTFTLSRDVTTPIQIKYLIAGGTGTATFVTDYVLTGGSANVTDVTATGFTITSGRIATLIVDPLEDGEFEGDETVSLILNTGDGYKIGTSNSVTGTITNSLPPTTVTVSVDPASVEESGQNTMLFTFTMAEAATADTVVTYRLLLPASEEERYTIAGLDDYANPGIDPTTGIGTVIIRAGQRTATVRISPTNNTLIEYDESVELSLVDGTGYVVGTITPVVGTIVDTSIPQVFLKVGTTSNPDPLDTDRVAVAENGTDSLLYTFTRAGDPLGRLTVFYRVEGTANQNDYTGAVPTPLSGQVRSITFEDQNVIRDRLLRENPSLDPDEATRLAKIEASVRVVTVTPTDDRSLEGDETVSLSLFPNESYEILTPEPIIGEILDDEANLPEVSLFLSPDSVVEDGDRNLVYTFVLSVPAPTNGITINYTITGTALGSDYTGIDSQGRLVTPGGTKTIFIPAGQSQATVTLTPQKDDLVEGDETVAFTLTAGNGYTISPVNIDPNSETVIPVVAIITDSVGVTPVTDPTVTLSVSPTVASETGTEVLVYTFALQQRATEDIEVKYKIRLPEFPEQEELIATEADYNNLGPVDADGNRTVIIRAGQSSATVRISPFNDQLVERDEIVEMSLELEPEKFAGYTPGTTVPVVGTITSDDIPSISLRVSASTDPNPTFTDQVSVSEQGNAEIYFTFNRSQLSLDRLTIFYTVGGTANNPQDYTGALPSTQQQPSSITFEDLGVVRQRVQRENPDWTPEQVEQEARLISSTQTVAISVVDDEFFEGDEEIVFQLLFIQGAGYNLGTTGPVTATILDNEQPLPEITLSVTPESVLEDGTGTLIYTFALSTAASKDLTINYTIGGTADVQDYTGATPGGGQSILIEQGKSSGTLVINPTNDTEVEADETVAITLGQGDGYIVTTTTPVIGTIANDDILIIPEVSLTVTPASVREDSSQGLLYTFALSAAVQTDLVINYDITGTAGVQDYTGETPGAAKTITIGAGQTQGSVIINPLQDEIFEADETVIFTLTNGEGYSIVGREGIVGTITNFEKPLPQVSVGITNASVREDNTDGMTYTFSLNAPAENDLVINYGLGGTASAADYTGATPGSNKTITIAAGQTQTSLTLKPVDDDIAEPNETVVLTLGGGTGYTAQTTDPLTGTIVNFTRQPVDRLTTSFYRFQNLNRPGTYLFANETEAASIRQNFPNFREEGFAFKVATQKTDPLMQGFYRFQNTDQPGTYLYAGEQEAASIRQNHRNFKEEGLAFYAYASGFGQGTTDFSRFQSKSLPGTYLFTGPGETSGLVVGGALGSSGFTFEGSAFAALG